MAKSKYFEVVTLFLLKKIGIINSGISRYLKVEIEVLILKIVKPHSFCTSMVLMLMTLREGFTLK